ncbi:hypothetical protein RISK_006622 [Rhodopirellula islandica]|uniref:Uncharacterized protein n=1 Tax=Rhodopirellula islandica TaxID=595434 RepID=A0A0J1B4T3_RHOIS|nr:hypothetical protein RISK_006622 [Rhodopirellula islandica]
MAWSQSFSMKTASNTPILKHSRSAIPSGGGCLQDRIRHSATLGSPESD